MEFFFVSGFWAGNPIKVGRDPFPPYTGEMGIFVQRVCYFSLLVLLLLLYPSNFICFFFFSPPGVRRPSLSKFYLDHVQQASSFTNRAFHSLVTLRHLATWRLGSEPTEEALAQSSPHVDVCYLHCILIV